MKNYDKLWLDWSKKTTLSEINTRERNKLAKHVQNVMVSLGDDSKEILNRTPFNSIFGNKLRIVIPNGNDASLLIGEHMRNLWAAMEKSYLEKKAKGDIGQFSIDLRLNEEVVEQSIEGGRETKEVSIFSPIFKITYTNKMGDQRKEELSLGRAFSKFKMKEAADYWTKTQSMFVKNEQDVRRSISIAANDLNYKKAKKEQNWAILITRSPIDIVRMSDFPGISSCHSPRGSYFLCAMEEARRGGAVAYMVKKAEIDKIIELGKLQSPEIFIDEDINQTRFPPEERERAEGTPMSFGDEEDNELSENMIQAYGRIRIRRVVDLDNVIEYLVPETSAYSDQGFAGFRSTIASWCAKEQTMLFQKDGKFVWPSKDSDLAITGGSYQDEKIETLLYNHIAKIHRLITDQDLPIGLVRIDDIRSTAIEDPYEGETPCYLTVREIINLSDGVSNLQINRDNVRCDADDNFESVPAKITIELMQDVKLTKDIAKNPALQKEFISKLIEINPLVANLGKIDSVFSFKNPTRTSIGGRVSVSFAFIKNIKNSAEIAEIYEFANSTIKQDLLSKEGNKLALEMGLIDKPVVDTNYFKTVTEKIKNHPDFYAHQTGKHFIFSYLGKGIKQEMFTNTEDYAVKGDQLSFLPSPYHPNDKSKVGPLTQKSLTPFNMFDIDGYPIQLLSLSPYQQNYLNKIHLMMEEKIKIANTSYFTNMIQSMYTKFEGRPTLMRGRAEYPPQTPPEGIVPTGKKTIADIIYQSGIQLRMKISLRELDNSNFLPCFGFGGSLSFEANNDALIAALDFLDWAVDNIDSIVDTAKGAVIEILRAEPHLALSFDKQIEEDDMYSQFSEMELLSALANYYKNNYNFAQFGMSKDITNKYYFSFMLQIKGHSYGFGDYKIYIDPMKNVDETTKKEFIEIVVTSKSFALNTTLARAKVEGKVLTTDNFVDALKDIPKIIENKVKELGNYTIFNQDLKQENAKINRKLLKEKLITWYKRNKK